LKKFKKDLGVEKIKVKIEGYENGKITIYSDEEKRLDEVLDLNKVVVSNCEVINAEPHYRLGRAVKIEQAKIQTDMSKPLIYLRDEGKGLLDECLKSGFRPMVHSCYLTKFEEKEVEE